MLTFAPGKRSAFPLDNYTPYGYLYTPNHTGTAPGGLLRSVPAIGFGLYRRGFTWYGFDALNTVNAYLSLLLPSVCVDGVLLAEPEDFPANAVELVSRYHSSNILSYDFSVCGVKATLAWYSDQKDTLFCRVALENTTASEKAVRMDAAHAYGMNDKHWWGSDAITARYVPDRRAMVSKILAYGDIYVLSSDRTPDSGFVAQSHDALDTHRRIGTPLGGSSTAVPMPGPLYSALEWTIPLVAKEKALFTLALSRGVNEKAALKTLERALDGANALLNTRIDEDNVFCENMFTLSADWPAAWRRGMVYHFQTLRMNVYPSMGIFTHHWDGMQTANPRMVLGETCIDMYALRYADIDTALEVMTTTFEDSPDVYVPCCREDGSVNMIGTDGSECPTALMWGFPLKTLRALLADSGNVAWLRRLYPRLKECIAWWVNNRTDSEGWFHCNNSWESGQDGSKRFVTGDDDGCPEGMNANHVRAVDVESTMAQTAQIMAEFADVLGMAEDAGLYRAMAERGVERVRRMFFDDRFRDVNAQTHEPFMADAHDDPMLTMPLATAQAMPEQIEKTRWILDEMLHVVDEHNYAANGAGIFWPSILETLTAALLNTGRPEDAAHVAAVLADAAWVRDDSRCTWPRTRTVRGIPEPYQRLIPGNARENLSDDLPTSGTENYGWGCVDIALFGEYILGVRAQDPLGTAFFFQPVLPAWIPGAHYEVYSFPLLGLRADFFLKRENDGLRVTIQARDGILLAASDQGKPLGCANPLELHLGRAERVVLMKK